MQAPPVTDIPDPATGSPEVNPWLEHLGRGMYLRGHISVFAVGSVLLLGIDLLSGGGVWADTAIGAWGMLVVVHGILMIIARLLQELLTDDGEQAIRPSSEMQWNAPSTWELPERVQPRWPGRPGQNHPAQAPATPDQTAQENPPEPERVSWKAATDAAWLSQPRPTPGTPGQDAPSDDKDDDFTPLKLD